MFHSIFSRSAAITLLEKPVEVRQRLEAALIAYILYLKVRFQKHLLSMGHSDVNDIMSQVAAYDRLEVTREGGWGHVGLSGQILQTQFVTIVQADVFLSLE